MVMQAAKHMGRLCRCCSHSSKPMCCGEHGIYSSEHDEAAQESLVCCSGDFCVVPCLSMMLQACDNNSSLSPDLLHATTAV